MTPVLAPPETPGIWGGVTPCKSGFSRGPPASSRWPRRAFASQAPSDGPLFPLPLPSQQVGHGTSKVCRRRGVRRTSVWQSAACAVGALNRLYGCEGLPPPSPGTEAQQAAVKHIWGSCARRYTKCSFSEPEAARQLLGGHLDYLGDGCKVVAYSRDLLSLPDMSRRPVDLMSVMTGSLCKTMEPDIMLADEGVQADNLKSAPRQGYTDVVLKGSRAERLAFYKRLAACGIVVPLAKPRSHITPFFVEKKNGKQRLVLDCRISNSLFRRAPPMDMGGAEALQRVEVPEGRTLHQGSADIKNCFYQCLMPEWLVDYFAFEDRLTGPELLEIFGSAALAGTNFAEVGGFVAMCVLPMGFN